MGRYIYADNAGTTRLSPAVAFKAFIDVFRAYGNPSSLHTPGRLARKKIENYRKEIKRMLEIQNGSVVFAHGGTHGNNILLRGAVERLVYNEGKEKVKIVVSEAEHVSLFSILKYFEKIGVVDVERVSVRPDGKVDMKDYSEKVAGADIVMIMHVNNETGAINPLRKIVNIARRVAGDGVSVFSDMAQSLPYLDINIESLGVDGASFSGSKIHGPKSSGCIYVKDLKMLSPSILGGDQEFGIVGGTEDLFTISGFYHAMDMAIKRREKKVGKLLVLKKRLVDGLKSLGVNVGISEDYDGTIAGIVYALFEGMPGMRLVVEYDVRGVAVSSKTACISDFDGLTPSATAVFCREGGARPFGEVGTVRFSLGADLSVRDIDKILSATREILAKIEKEKSVFGR